MTYVNMNSPSAKRKWLFIVGGVLLWGIPGAFLTSYFSSGEWSWRHFLFRLVMWCSWGALFGFNLWKRPGPMRRPNNDSQSR